MNKELTSMWYEQRVEAFIDGELPDNEARLFAARLKIDKPLRQSVEMAITLQGALHALPQQKCPLSVTQGVMAATGASPSRWWRLDWGWPALATAAVLVMALSLPLLKTNEPQQPSAAELAQARRDLAIAMAYLEHASSIASHQVGRQLLNEGFVRPLTTGLQYTLPETQTPPPSGTEDAS